MAIDDSPMQNIIGADDEVMLVDLKTPEKRYLVKVDQKKFSTKNGDVDLSALVGENFGCITRTHMGRKFAVLKPTLYDRIMRKLKRGTQIVYPKDAAYICLYLGLRPGMKVFECGTGSGVMTVVMANAVSPNGKVVTYEADERFYDTSGKNLASVGLIDCVDRHLKNLADGIEGGPFDAAFIDVREPWLYLDTIYKGVGGGIPVAFVLPTTNQICELLGALEHHGGFTDFLVGETFLRFYKPVSERLRPDDRMVAHTTYMVFARTMARDMEFVAEQDELRALKRVRGTDVPEDDDDNENRESFFNSNNAFQA